MNTSNCKYCNRAIFFGIINSKRVFFNEDDKRKHRCREYLDAHPEQADKLVKENNHE